MVQGLGFRDYHRKLQSIGKMLAQPSDEVDRESQRVVQGVVTTGLRVQGDYGSSHQGSGRRVHHTRVQ